MTDDRADDAHEVTRLLGDLRDGHGEALADLLAAVQRELHGLAAGHLRRERPDHTLQPTALVNEAYLRLVDSTRVGAEDRQRFLAIAARAMRRVLVDHARRRKRLKRGGDAWQRVTVDLDLELSDAGGAVDVVELSELLDKLQELDERACRIIEMHFFAGLSFAEVAEALGITERTAYKDWAAARLWLARELKASGEP